MKKPLTVPMLVKYHCAIINSNLFHWFECPFKVLSLVSCQPYGIPGNMIDGSSVIHTKSESVVLPKQLLSLTLVHPNVSQGCQGGCATCSDYNGCLSCKPRLFFVLERIGMKQIGVCLSSCPSGYYGTRYPDINKCTKCKADCDTCFNKNFCTKCKSGFYLHLGKCLDSCPEGLEANNHTMECVSIGKKGRERKRKKLNKEQRKETSSDSKGLESSRETPEHPENKGRRQEKRKAQEKQQKSVSVSTVH
ncbi:hypothetical protein STEG23_004401 [Scotinomys teguina]